MRIVRTESFKKDFQQLPAHVQKVFEKKMQLFMQNVKHPSLRVKKMQGFENRWEASITKLFRAAYEFSLDNRNTDNSQLWTWLEENKVTTAEQDEMWEYISNRLEQDKRYGVPELIQENIPDLRTPAEAERFLGMVK